MFGYSCPYCAKGWVREQIFVNYETRRKDVHWIVPRAKIGVCDKCGGRTYHVKEVKRWEKLKPK
jgi:hypothetical protein